LADWQISNFIVGHKYRRGAWNLPHKFHLYLISINNKGTVVHDMVFHLGLDYCLK
jgi:hypothetical protein